VTSLSSAQRRERRNGWTRLAKPALVCTSHAMGHVSLKSDAKHRRGFLRSLGGSMVRNKAVTVSLSQEEAELVKFWAEQRGQRPAEWARDQVLKGLNASGPSQTEVLLAEVCGMSNLLAEFMAEMLVFAMSGDEAAGLAKAKEFFDRAMKRRYEDAATLLRNQNGNGVNDGIHHEGSTQDADQSSEHEPGQ